MLPIGPKKLDLGTSYVVIKESGYTKYSTDDIAFRESLSSLKQLLHTCLMLNLIELQGPAFSLTGLLLENPTIEATIIDLANQNEVSGSIRLPVSISSHIRRIILNTSTKQFTVAKEHGEEEIRNLFRTELEEISNLIETDDRNTQFVKSAIEWAFDSKVEENETVSFIQLSIGLEAILGEETGATNGNVG